MKTLLIDNYDSFTFNLYQLIAEVNRVPPLVVRNDCGRWEDVRALDFDNIVISPGPGRPENEADFGICKEAILQSPLPILGVCLGHQGICHLFGGTVDYAKTVMHGRASLIHHKQQDIFRNIPSPFSAIRYHSLYVKSLPKCLQVLAQTEDGMIMSARHTTKPIWSVQFHPESVRTEYGRQLFENFRSLSVDLMKQDKIPARKQREAEEAKYNILHRPVENPASVTGGHGQKLQIHYRRIPLTLSAEDVFYQNFAHSPKSFWLDSALTSGLARFSYMGDASGPHAEYVTYHQSAKKMTVEFNGEIIQTHETVFDFLDRKLKERYVNVEDLPFDFNAGYVGYFGYELKADCGYHSPYSSNLPDAAFVFADRLIAFDHAENIVYLVCLDDTQHPERATDWLNKMQAKLECVPQAPTVQRAKSSLAIGQTFRHDAPAYLEKIASARAEIRKGESYEICLTNMITFDAEIDPLNTYRALRRANPAPYASYLNFPEVSVLSASPEKFITLDARGIVESKPIKGTRKRGKTAAEDEALRDDLGRNEKDRSENLMIVDLLRNDLGRVCDIGSVSVSDMFAVESYATVHQLVSTIRGRLQRGISAIGCIRACFPGGSMTGAPKKRTVEILDKLEAGPRGVYSGSIGFLALNGSADLSIAIRTIVEADKNITVGVGGAIVDLSDPQDELDEMLLKSQALTEALAETNIKTG